MLASVQEGAQNGVALCRLFQPNLFQVLVQNALSLSHHLGRDGWLVIDALLQHGWIVDLWRVERTGRPR